MVVVCQVNPNLQVLQIHMNFLVIQMQVESRQLRFRNGFYSNSKFVAGNLYGASGVLGSHNPNQKGWILHVGVGDKLEFQHLNQ